MACAAVGVRLAAAANGEVAAAGAPGSLPMPVLASDWFGGCRSRTVALREVPHGSVDRERPGANRCAVGAGAVRAPGRPRSRRPAAGRSRHDAPAHVFTSIIPILIIAGAVRSRLDRISSAIIAEHLGLDAATADILDEVPARRRPGAAGDGRHRGGASRHRRDVVRAGSGTEPADDLAHADGRHQVRLALARRGGRGRHRGG